MLGKFFLIPGITDENVTFGFHGTFGSCNESTTTTGYERNEANGKIQSFGGNTKPTLRYLYKIINQSTVQTSRCEVSYTVQ